LDHGAEHAGRDGEVVERPLAVAQPLFEPLVSGGLAVVAVDVAQQLGELGEGVGVGAAAVLGDALPRTFDELVAIPAGARNADHRHGHPAALHQALQGGEDLLVGEVAGGAEEDEGVRLRALLGHYLASFFSTCPPKPKRMAESTRFWKSSSPREAKRSKRAAVSTCAGTASSMAAASVQRPSPESATLPAKSPRSGLLASAAAVRSRSHEVTTLPRRQSSATSAS